jgi:peptidoglycan/LPS O-acetylase OafA/YrhL
LNRQLLARRTRQDPNNQSHRLRGVDALRGAAALGVVLYHAVGPKGQSEPLILRWLATPFLPVIRLGYVGVFLFFVISGFCIHLSRARAQSEDRVPVSFTDFWKRRIRRLYPPYLIALTLFLAIAGFTTKFAASFNYIRDVLLHLLMLHNLDSRTVYSINGVFWTLAIEEQLYLAYFLLLFLRRRWGWTRTLIICLATRLVWFVLFTAAQVRFKINVPISEAAASYWFNWALGAISVEAMFGLVKLPPWSYKIKVAAAAILACVGISFLLPAIQQKHEVIYSTLWLVIHPLWGLAFFVLLNWFVAAEKLWRARAKVPAGIRCLSVIGIFSYSLYLTHELVALEEFRFARLGLSPLLTAILLTTPISIAFAWLFFKFAEKPYLSSPRARPLAAGIMREPAAAVDA